MATKFGLAGGIPERKVRPIWDAIDSRQFKNALKHVTTLLAKHPNSPYALVRSLILIFIAFVLCCFSIHAVFLLLLFHSGSQSAGAWTDGKAWRGLFRCAQREGASLRERFSADGRSHSQHPSDCVSATGSLLASFICFFFLIAVTIIVFVADNVLTSKVEIGMARTSGYCFVGSIY